MHSSVSTGATGSSKRAKGLRLPRQTGRGKKEGKRWRIKWEIRGEEQTERLEDWNGYSAWNSGAKVKNTVGGERKTENKSEAVIAVSPERNRGIGVDYSKETDKAPLTAASSCFLRLCHHMTPP